MKVLDFGLAKALDSTGSTLDVSSAPTVTGLSPTEAGVILGTAAYMSPEQAAGQKHRSSHRHLGVRHRPHGDADGRSRLPGRDDDARACVGAAR